MSAQESHQVAPGIVLRLRIVFLTISLVLIGALSAGSIQVNALNRSVMQLTQSSVPVFVRTKETERNLKDLLLLLQRIDRVDQLEELAPLSSELTERLSALHANTSELTGAGSSADAAALMKDAVLRIDLGASKTVETKRAIIRHEQTLRQQIEALHRLHESMRSLLEDLSYQAADTAQRSLLARHTSGADERDSIEQIYNQKLIAANAITSISLGIEAARDIVSGLPNISEAEELEKIEQALRFKLRGIVVLIGQLQDSTARAEMAALVVRMRSLLFNHAGIIEESGMLQTSLTVLAAQKTEKFAPVELISTLSNQLTETAERQINEANTNLAKTTDSMVVGLLFALLLSLATIGWALIFIVERQINKRMACLTRAVRAIADGQTAYSVDVYGADELGKMATALEVFKLNALELQRSNIELEKFAYVAAHDLRSPLRAIQDLTEWTLEDSENVFSEEGRENMALLQKRIGRLNQLLSDLLTYSRVGKEADDLAEISLRDVVKETADMLDPDDKFQIRYSGTHDAIVTYATPLRQIFLNLISNSIKHHDQTSGNITVVADYRLGRIFCSVQDDGPGIPPRYHDRIFGLFQTLQSRDQVEGSGLGLAIIRKSLERYGGSISVHSDPDHARGTMFTFEMPEESEAGKIINQAA